VTVNDLLAVMGAFDEALALVFGAALAVFLVDSVIRWFALVFLKGDAS